MKKLIIIFFVIISFPVLAQEQHRIQGSISGFPGGTIYLASFYGEQTRIFDSLMMSKDGIFEFTLNESHLPGYYRVFLDKEKYVDIIYNHEDIVFSSDFEAPFENLSFSSSSDNQLYYNFLPFVNQLKINLDLLTPLVDYYDRTDPFYQEACKQYEENQLKRNHYIDSIAENFPETYAAKIIKTQKREILPFDLNETDRIAQMKYYYWDYIDLTDTSLIRSNVLPNLAIDYMSYYSNRYYSQEQLEASRSINSDNFSAS